MRKANRSDVQDTGGIKTLPQNRWEIVAWSELSSYMQGSIWEVYDVSYGSIGKHVPDIKRFGEKYQYLFLIDVDDDVKPDAFIAYKKTHAGYKIALGGTDGTRKAKKAMILKMQELIRQPGWYAEASHKVADILESAGMRPIDDEEVVRKTLKGKEIVWLGDGKYSRQLGNSSISAAKSLYGTPKVAMHLSAARRLGAGENEPTKPDLWAKVQALAKGEKASITVGGKKVNGPNEGKGFTVFPSAYANGWASKVYKDLGGGWKKKASVGKHKLPPLPYAYDALEPHISEETLRFHHDKHHKAYVDGLNKAEEQISEAREDEDWDAIPAFNALQEFNSGGHFLHTIYWPSLIPTAEYKDPSDKLVGAIEANFGSWDAFRAQMKESTIKVRGSGWGVLVLTPAGLRVVTVMNHENGVLWDGVTLLPIDAWEHAYYLDYQNDRSAHFDAVFDNIVNWSEVERRLDVARQGLRKHAGWWQSVSGMIGDGPADAMQEAVDDIRSMYRDHPEIDREPTLSELWDTLGFVTGPDVRSGEIKLASETGDGSTHVGIFAPLPPEIADQFPAKEEDSSRPHVTLCYVGSVPDKKDQKALVEAVRDFYAQEIGPIKARLSGVDYFRHANGSVAYAKVVFSKDMGYLKDRLKSFLEDRGVEVHDQHPLAFNPHVTLAYYDDPYAVWEGQTPTGSWAFNEVEVWGLPEVHRLTLGRSLRGAWGPTLREARGKAKKDVGHGGLDEWFSGHGGAKGKGEDATWGDWVSISPVKKTLDSGKKVEPGDIVGPCGISDDPDWKDFTKGGKDPLKCMPREKAYDMGKKERAEKAKAKQKAERADSNRGKKPTHTPTFKKEKKEKEASLSERVAAKYQNKRKVPRHDGKGETTIYEYSEGQVKSRNRAKAERVEKLRGKIGDLRKQVKKDLASEDAKKRLTALAISLIDETFERVGNEGSAKEGHFGVTTLLKRHLSFEGGKARLRYVGKSGVKHDKTISNKKVVSMLKDLATSKKGEDPLFCEGDDCVVRARDVNAYLRPYEVTAKDLRGLHANEQMKLALKDSRKAGPSLPKDKKEREKILKEEFKKALEQAAAAVGHQASTLKSQYLVPGMEDAYLKDGTVLDSLIKKATLSDAEKEDRETERQVRKSPKAKPPRRDLERRRIDLDSEEDPDTKQDKKDRSNNYKDAHGRLLASWGSLLTARGPMPLEPGKVRKTDKGRYTGMNSDGATHTFDDEADAKAFAKGEGSEASEDSEAPKGDTDLTGKRDALMKKYRDMGLLDEGTLKSIEELAQDARSTADLEELADMAQQEADEAKAKKDEQKAREESPAAEKAKEKTIKDVSSMFKGDSSAESNVSEVLEDLSEEDYEAFTKAFESKSETLLKNPPKPAEIPDIIEDAKRVKGMADLESQVKSLAKDVAKLAEALAKVKYHEQVLDNPLVDAVNPLPKEGEKASESRVDRSKRAMEKYLEMDSEDRKRHFDRLQNEAERATGARKEAIEAVVQGIGIASVLQEGMEAKGVAGATSRLIQAAYKTGKIDKILEMSRKSDSPEQRAKDQKLIREVYEGLREEEWLDVIPEDHPGRGLADLLADPMGKGRFLSWDDKADIRARLSDMLIAETSFLDPALNESMGDATTAKYDEEAKKHRSQAAGAELILEEGDNIKGKVGSWTEKFTAGLAALVAKLQGKAPGSDSEERSPGTVWGEPGELYAKSPEGGQRGPFDNREKAEAWARGETPKRQASWHFEAWPANIFQ